MKIAFHTLGCKVNRYETEFLANKFAENGFDVIDPENDIADVYVVNSCTVTAVGDKKSRQALRRFRNANPNAITVLTGCFPQAFKDEAEKITEADIITGAKNRAYLIGYVKEFMITGERIVRVEPHNTRDDFEKMSISGIAKRTRTYVKIEDGCNRRCAYCIIPTARGNVRSKPLDEMKKELKIIAEKDAESPSNNNCSKEVVLTGVNLSSYGADSGKRLSDAVIAACSIEGIGRIRLSSLEPDLITAEDIKIFASLEKFCPHFHLSLQSGCDETLRRMNRMYTTSEYIRTVEKIRKNFKNPSITTDIIVGFPGETDREFQESCSFAESIGFARIHVFGYSDRSGTEASKMPEKIGGEIMKQRTSRMKALAENAAFEFFKTQIGREAEVLFETLTEKGYLGYSENYTPVLIKNSENIPDIRGVLKQVKINSFGKKYSIGELI